MKHIEEKIPYEAPELEIVEFDLADHIASSSDMGSGTTCSEGIFGLGDNQ